MDVGILHPWVESVYTPSEWDPGSRVLWVLKVLQVLEVLGFGGVGE
jgi:hypothetical protein